MIDEFPVSEVRSDGLNNAKDRVKHRLGAIYPLLVKLLSPVYDEDPVPAFLKVGAGRCLRAEPRLWYRAYPGAVNVDGVGYANVHVVCDLEALPFEDASVDRLLSIAVLEQ